MKKIHLFIIATLMSSLSWGQSFTEDFNYPTNDSLKSNSWPKLFNATTPSLFVNSSGLSYTGSPSSGVGFGVNITTTPTTAASGRFSGTVTSGSMYMSFLVTPTAAQAGTLNSNYAGIMQGPSPSPGVAARALIRSATGGFNFGVGKNAAVTVATGANFETTVRPFNTTYLVVIKYTINAVSNTDDIVEMWINPVLGGMETAPTLTQGSGAADPSSGTASLTGVLLFPRSTGPTLEIDAIRYGATWAFVTPITVPTLTVSSATLNFGTVPVSVPSSSLSFNLAGTFLTPAPGTITVNAPTNFEVSNDNMTWGSSTTIPNSAATLAATPVYVRFSSAMVGASTGNITFSGGGVAAPPTVAVTAAAGNQYFSKPTGNIELEANWGTAADGTGTPPPNFINDYQIFTICNRATYTLDDDFQVMGIGSKIIIGNGTDAINLKLPAGFTILNDLDHRVDVNNNATVEIANKIYRSSGPGDFSKTPFPFFGTMGNSSTVEYTWNGTDVADTVRIPAETFGNLKLVNGLKYFSPGFAFANGNLEINNVQAVNGTGNALASVLVRGSVTMSNSFFDTDVSADANRFNLNLGGSGTQTISGGDFYVGQFRTQAVSPTIPAFTLDIVLGTNTNIFTGTITGGGISLQQPTHNLSLNGNTLTMGNGSSFVPFTSSAAPGNLGTISGTSTSNIIINKTLGTAAIGTVRFAAGGEILNNFNFNSAGAGTNNLTLGTPLTVNGILSLNAGNILLGANNLTIAGTISGGSLPSHIVTNSTGALQINGVGASSKIFPVGPSAALYHPATISNSGTSDNFSVNVASLAPTCGDAAASVTARWNITEQTVGGSNCTIALDYTGAATGGTYLAASAKVVDCGGSAPFYNNGSVTGTIATGTGFTSFSPFGITSDPIILPVSFINFSGSRTNKGNQLTWITGSEQNSLGFDVERSLDGQSFTKIGFVNTLATGGSSTSNLTYTFIDDKINAGTVQYYRLRQVDKNNQSKYSVIVTIKGEKVAIITIVGIAPNPVQNNLVASISSPTKNLVNLQVVDMMGRILQQQQVTIQEGTNAIPVNVSTLGSGMYFLKAIYAESNQTNTIKFMKQ
jgi:Secretion system C-terminal sorting domain